MKIATRDKPLGRIVALAAALLGAGTLLSQTTPDHAIRVDVDLVLVNATVTNSKDQYVHGLEREHFTVWEDKIEQEIVHFSTEDAPVTLGIIIDRSGSMGQSLRTGPITNADASALSWARDSAYSCLQDALKRDEFFMIEFSEEAELVVDFTNDMTKLRLRLPFLKAGGNTALWDAIDMGVRKMDGAAHSRKALLVLTDGEENDSRLSLTALKNLIREDDVRIYFFGYGAGGLAELTGGRIFKGAEPCQQLQADLKNQYVIGYKPSNRLQDGRWREIRLKMETDRLPVVMRDVRVRAKTGYYANQN